MAEHVDSTWGSHFHGHSHTMSAQPGALGVNGGWPQEPTKEPEKEQNWVWSEQEFKWVVGEEEAKGEDDIPGTDWSRQDDVRIDLDREALFGPGYATTQVQEYSDQVSVFNLPLYGRIQFGKHRPGYIHISIIVLYWIYGTWSPLALVLYPHEIHNGISPIYAWLHLFFSVMTIISLFRASTLNPGRCVLKLPKERPPKPNSPPGEQDYCFHCQQYRPWKSHHCRICGQCVRRMDHHCPWINNCVGEDNHYAFMQLTCYAFLLSFWVFLVMVSHYYWWPELEAPEVEPFSWRHKKGLLITAFILAVLMAILMCMLTLTQHVGIVLGLTTIDWKKLEDEIRKVGHFTFDMFPRPKYGCFHMYKEFCGPGSPLFWIFPCRRKVPVSQASYI